MQKFIAAEELASRPRRQLSALHTSLLAVEVAIVDVVSVLVDLPADVVVDDGLLDVLLDKLVVAVLLVVVRVLLDKDELLKDDELPLKLLVAWLLPGVEVLLEGVALLGDGELAGTLNELLDTLVVLRRVDEPFDNPVLPEEEPLLLAGVEEVLSTFATLEESDVEVLDVVVVAEDVLVSAVDEVLDPAEPDNDELLPTTLPDALEEGELPDIAEEPLDPTVEAEVVVPLDIDVELVDAAELPGLEAWLNVEEVLGEEARLLELDRATVLATVFERDELSLASDDTTVDEKGELPGELALPVVDEEPTPFVEETPDPDEALEGEEAPATIVDMVFVVAVSSFVDGALIRAIEESLDVRVVVLVEIVPPTTTGTPLAVAEPDAVEEVPPKTILEEPVVEADSIAVDEVLPTTTEEVTDVRELVGATELPPSTKPPLDVTESVAVVDAPPTRTKTEEPVGVAEFVTVDKVPPKTTEELDDVAD